MSLLLVDDDPAGLASLEEILSGLGEPMVTARSGRDALRQLLRREFAVVLLDVVMPELDGFETARMIRARRSTQGVPIIFLTALSHGEPPELRAYAMGAVDYVSKPVRREVLRSKVGVFVDLAKKTRQLRETNEQLREANRVMVQQQLRVLQTEKLASVGLLAAGVAHEINNPLTGVLNCVALLKDGNPSEERRQLYFETISRALGQIGSTVQALLGYAREQPAELSKVDLAECLATCLPLIAPVMRSRSVEVVQQLAPGEVVVWGNSSQLSQAALNVLLNAVQASPPGAKVAVKGVRGEGRQGVRF
jgi:CheY-like chemotaxis protein